MNSLCRKCLPLVLLSMLASVASAQDITKGSIAGVVRDPSGAVVGDAVVKLTLPLWRPFDQDQFNR